MKKDIDYCIVREGDTLASLAEKHLGAAMLWHLLAEINDIPQDGIKPGDRLLLHPVGLKPEK